MRYATIAGVGMLLSATMLLGKPIAYPNFELYNPSKTKTIYYQLRFKNEDAPIIDTSGGRWVSLESRKTVPVPFTKWLDIMIASDQEGKDAQLYTFYFDSTKPEKTFYIKVDSKPDDTIEILPQNLRTPFKRVKLRKKGIPTKENLTQEELEKARDVIKKE